MSAALKRDFIKRISTEHFHYKNEFWIAALLKSIHVNGFKHVCFPCFGILKHCLFIYLFIYLFRRATTTTFVVVIVIVAVINENKSNSLIKNKNSNY